MTAVPLIQTSLAVIKNRHALASKRRLLGPPSSVSRTTSLVSKIDHLHAVAQVVGHEDRAIVFGHLQAHRPTADIDAIKSVTIILQLTIDQITRTAGADKRQIVKR